MKALFMFLPLLFLFGCSANMSTNPQEQQTETHATFTTSMNGQELSPVLDIEPPELPCETNQTGFIRFRNRDLAVVRCQIGDTSVTLTAHMVQTIEIPYGAYTLEWFRGNQSYSQEPIIVATCKTTRCTFDPKRVYQDR